MSSTRQHADKRRANRKTAGRGGRDARVPARGAVPRQTLPRYPNKAPALSTVRGWLRGLEAAGEVERTVERTGKPGRPPHLWSLTEKGQQKADARPPREELTREQARKLLHEAAREELGIGGREFVRQLDAGLWECGWRCACAMPHDPGLRALLRTASWSRMSVFNAQPEA